MGAPVVSRLSLAYNGRRVVCVNQKFKKSEHVVASF